MSRITFDTLDKKPKLYNITVVSVLTLIIMLAVYFYCGESAAGIENLILSLYVLTVGLLLFMAFFRQFRSLHT